MRQKLLYIQRWFALLCLLLIGAIGQTYAQFDPDSPPEPGMLSVYLTSSPNGCAWFEQTSGNGLYVKGANVTVKVYPYADYEFVAWMNGSTQVSTNAMYTFTVDKTTRLIAKLRFNPSDNPLEPGAGYFNLITTAEPAMGGSINQSGRGLYKLDEQVVLTANAYTDYIFDHWEMGGEIVSRDAEYTLKMPAKRTYVKAFYKWNPNSPSEPGGGECRLHLVNDNNEAGYISQSGSGTYPIGSSVSIVASPFPGYSFVGWYEGERLISSSLTYNIQITKSITTLEARFKVRSGDEKPGISVSGGTVGATDGVKGSIKVNGTLLPGQTVEVVAEPDEGYAFVGWYLNGLLITEAEMSYSLLLASDNISLIAMFTEIPFSLNIEGNQSGEGSSKWAMVTRLRGNVAHLSAKQVVNYAFVGWFRGDELLSRDPEYDLNISSLRTSLPNITAKYMSSPSGNDDVISPDKFVQTYISAGNLVMTTSELLRHVDIYTINGKLLQRWTNVLPFTVNKVTVPETAIIMYIKLSTGESLIRKLY